ncbi:MAG: hypothetical protein AAGJ18_29035 [Bacteroidota bacterium]
MSVITKTPTFFQKTLYVLLAFTLVCTSCQKENALQLAETVESPTLDAATATRKALQMAEQHGLANIFDVEGIQQLHPSANTAKIRETAEKAIGRFGGHQTYADYQVLFERAINPDDFECGSPTFLDEFAAASLEGFTDEQANLLFGNTPAIFLEALFFDDTPEDENFGINGEYNTSLRRNFINLKRFWDIPTDIILVDLKGTIFKDEALVSEIVQAFFVVGLDENGNPIFADKAFADQYANFLKIAFSDPIFQDYNHPLFSFNAFASAGNPGLGIPNKIAMGDGLMEAYRANGLRTMADNFILAHEYGHQIQFANGYFDGVPNTAEGTRYTELMADAYGAYFMTHGRGAFAEPAVITQMVKTGFSIGDCFFDSPSHHGTHNQRSAAAAWGGNLARRKAFLDPPLSSQAFFELFLEEFPNLIKPDAG